jgi:hypothetical protein
MSSRIASIPQGPIGFLEEEIINSVDGLKSTMIIFTFSWTRHADQNDNYATHQSTL